MNESIIDYVIKINSEFKKELFGLIPEKWANEIWFYAHLGNYGNTVCRITDKVASCPDSDSFRFELSFYRVSGAKMDNAYTETPLFMAVFDSTTDQWENLIAGLKKNARAILDIDRVKDFVI